MKDKFNYYTNNTWVFLILGLFIGAYCFFHSPAELSLIINDKHEGAGYWYRILSESIFKTQTIYIAESILLPLISKILGASTSVVRYLVLTAFITLLMLPVICVVFRKNIATLKGTVSAIIIFSFTYSYLEHFELGFPDSLTIILLSLMLIAQGKYIFFCTFLAALSHFSTAALAIIGYIGLSLAIKFNNKESIQNEKFSIYGLVTGKIFLICWGYIFNYNLNSRINFVLEQGFGYFWKRYIENPELFWYTPGKLFLIFNGITLIFFLIKRKYIISIAQISIVLIAYFSLFVTVDGLRVFAVVVAPGYLLIIITLVNSVFKK